MIIFISFLYFTGLVFIDEPGVNPFSKIEIISILSILVLSFYPLLKTFYFHHKSLSLFSVLFFFTLSSILILVFVSKNLISAFAAYIIHFKYLFLIFFFKTSFKSKMSTKFFFKSIYLFSTLIIILSFLKEGIYPIQIHEKGITINELLNLKRFKGYLVNPNVFGMFIYSAWIFCLIYREQRDSKESLLSFNIISILYLFPIILTNSRRALLIFMLSYLYLLFKKLSRLKKILVFLIISSLFVMFFNFEQIWSYRNQSNLDRIEELLSIFIALDLPTFLFGKMGEFGPGSLDYNSGDTFFRIHNYFLYILLDYGIFFTIIIFAILFSPVFIKRSSYNSIDINQINLAKVGLLGLLSSGLFGLTPISFPINFFISIFIGYLISKRNFYNEKIF